jgi:hypothetical protein
MMTHLIYILNRVWTIEFYKTNASFFLVVLGFAGGFMRGPDHIALAESFIASPVLLLIPVAVWIVYAAKVALFNQAILRRKETEFLFQLNLVNHHTQWLSLVAVLFNQLLPMYGYGLFLIVLCIKHHFFFTLTIVVSILVTIHAILTIMVKYSLSHPDQGNKTNIIKQLLDRWMIKPYPLMVMEWVIRRKLLMLVGFKLFSCLLLYGVSRLYEPTFDERFLGMTLAIAAGLHISMIYEVHRFETVHFSMIRQLPVSTLKRIWYTSVSLLLLILPESGMIFTLFNIHLSSIHCLIALSFLLSSVALMYAFLYIRDRREDEVTSFVFGGVMLFFVLILFKVPIILLTVVNAAVAFWIIRRCYYRFEIVG